MALIYLSSTFADLEAHRQAVYDTLRQMRHDVLAMEDYVASDQRPVAKCLADVRSADLYVGLFAWRYGYVPADENPEGRSVTELEFRTAAEAGTPCLVFLVDKKAPWPPPMMDAVTGDGDGGARITALRNELEARLLRATFSTPDDLARKVSVAVQQELVRQQQERIDDGIARQRELNAEAGDKRAERVRDRFVGQHLIDVTDRFHGRDEECKALGRLLADPATHLISVIGRAGIGKTALASRVLADAEQGRWPHTDAAAEVDGIVYLSTRTGGGISMERLFLSCSQMLGGEEEESLVRAWSQALAPPEEKAERLLEALAGGPFVILLDHADDLLDDEGRVADPGLRRFLDRSLTSRNRAHLVITSRRPVAVPAEARQHDHHLDLAQGLDTADGIALLRDLDPTGELGLKAAPDSQLEPVVDRLHGLPRALELVVALLAEHPFDSLEDVLARFYEEDEAVDALVTDAYRTLDAGARAVVDALAVLARPVPLWTVEFVAAEAAPGLDVPATLRRLVASRMVLADRVAKTAALHPIDRDIVVSRLPEEGPTSPAVLHRRAADAYARLRTPAEGWRTLLDAEPGLFEFEHRLASGDVDDAARVLSEIDVPFLIWKGFARRAQEMRGRVDGAITDARQRMHHAFAMGEIHLVIGPPTATIDWNTKAIVLAQEVGEPEVARVATFRMGEAYRRLGDAAKAADLALSAVATYDPATAPVWNSGLLEASLACAYAKRYDEALATGQRLLDLGTSTGDVLAQGRGHDCLSLPLLCLGRPQEALVHAQQAVTLYAQVDAPDPLAYVLNVQGMALVALDRLDEAVEALDRAQRDGKEDDNPRVEGFSLFNLAWARRLAGERPAALELARRAAAVLGAMAAAEAPAAARLVAGLEAEESGDAEGAAAAFGDCARLVAGSPDLFAPSYFEAAAAGDP